MHTYTSAFWVYKKTKVVFKYHKWRAWEAETKYLKSKLSMLICILCSAIKGQFCELNTWFLWQFLPVREKPPWISKIFMKLRIFLFSFKILLYHKLKTDFPQPRGNKNICKGFPTYVSLNSDIWYLWFRYQKISLNFSASPVST